MRTLGLVLTAVLLSDVIAGSQGTSANSLLNVEFHHFINPRNLIPELKFQLFIINGTPKQRVVYRINSLLNVATFLLFRILLLGWMTRWLTLHRDDVPLMFFTVGLLGKYFFI